MAALRCGSHSLSLWVSKTSNLHSIEEGGWKHRFACCNWRSIAKQVENCHSIKVKIGKFDFIGSSSCSPPHSMSGRGRRSVTTITYRQDVSTSPIHLMFESILKWNPSNCRGFPSCFSSFSARVPVCLLLGLVRDEPGTDGLNGNRNASDIVEQIKFFDEISFTRPSHLLLLSRITSFPVPSTPSSHPERKRWICVRRVLLVPPTPSS